MGRACSTHWREEKEKERTEDKKRREKKEEETGNGFIQQLQSKDHRKIYHLDS